MKVKYVDKDGNEFVSHRIEPVENGAIVRRGASPHGKRYPSVEQALKAVLDECIEWMAEGYCESFTVLGDE